MVVGLIALLCFYVTGCLEEKPLQQDRFTLLPGANDRSQSLSIAFRTTKQILSRKDFIFIVATNFIHTCRLVFGFRMSIILLSNREAALETVEKF